MAKQTVKPYTEEDRMDINDILVDMGRKDEDSNSNKNLISDMLRENAEAIGFDLTLIKEKGVTSRYIIFKSDYGLIISFYEMAKSGMGKCLRRYDYEGAGGKFVEEMMDILLTLARHAGVKRETLEAQKHKMHEATRYVVMISAIQRQTHKFDQDLAEHFFILDDGWPEDDGMDEADRQAFLEYLSWNADAPVEDIRGIYWFFKLEKEHDDYMELKRTGQFLRGLSEDGLKMTEERIGKRLEFETALRDNPEYMELVQKREDMYDGKGNLKNKYHSNKEDFPRMMDIMAETADSVFGQDDTAEEDGASSKSEEDDEEVRYRRSRVQIHFAIQKYVLFRDYRRRNPVTEENLPILETEFHQRFGCYMVPEAIISGESEGKITL
ncbi:MAG: hypothetical protein LIP11_16075 [Clostridiales bacterium]|nr:hypothetical protein [Clostridiales bacterium]